MYPFARMRPEDTLAAQSLIAWAFASPQSELSTWFDRIGPDAFRVLRADDKPVATVAMLEMGHWFGGRDVRTAGIAGVAVDPAHRGKNLAFEACAAAIAEASADGFALASLYPTAQRLYRKVGFEAAGLRCRIELPLASIGHQKSALNVREMVEADLPTVEALYTARARSSDGYLSRNAFHWWRAREPVAGARTFVVEGGRGEGDSRPSLALGRVATSPSPAAAGDGLTRNSSRVVGYVSLGTRRTSGRFNELVLGDLVGSTPDAGRRLLAFLGDHRSLCDKAVWHGGVSDPIVALLEEQSAKVEVAWRWMLRIVNVERALAARGYPQHVSASLDLAVTDELLPDNRGNFRLEVSGGRATVTRAGRGTTRVGVRGLAALYSGYMTPAALRAAELIEGPDDELARAAALFAGPTPAMADFF